MELKEFNQQFFDFLQQCPTPFHTTEYFLNHFRQAGFKPLLESEEWNIENGKGYYCIRDDGTIIGFKLATGSKKSSPWRMTGAHTDSPSLQIKPNPLRESHSLNQLCVEVYGGPLLATWFDRDLGIAGRVSLLSKDGTLLTRTVDFKRPVAIIPSLAIHLDRNANKEHTVEKQKQLYPLFCQSLEKETSFDDILLEQVKSEYPDLEIKTLLGFDLFCYNTQPPAFIGLNNDFIASGRLDNLVSCFVCLKALLQENTNDNCLLLCSNHEEIGSSSVAGAQGNFLSAVLERLLPERSLRSKLMCKSYFLSLDNAHSVHPNFTEKYDPQHLPLLNHGPIIKYNSNQRYATTSRSAGIYKMLASEIDIPVQTFVMNNDMACGSTIGPIAATTLGVQTVDLGVPSLSMHSIRETIGTKDAFMLYQSIAHFYSRPELPQIES
jgi:aspartyl aminopeptidase